MREGRGRPRREKSEGEGNGKRANGRFGSFGSSAPDGWLVGRGPGGCCGRGGFGLRVRQGARRVRVNGEWL